jgi:cytochrome P450
MMSVQERDAVAALPVRPRDDNWIARLPLETLGVEGGPLTPPADDHRLIPYTFPNGVVGYLSITPEDFREILTDPRFHAKRFLGEPQMTPSVSVPEMPGFIPGMNGPEHLRVRRLAAADFSVKRVEEIRPMIAAVVDRYLDEMEAHGSPVDLYTDYCLQIPSRVISAILGIPESHAEDFQDTARLTIGGSVSADDPGGPARAVARLHEVVAEVVGMKRSEPADDLITRLTQATDPEMSVEEICGLCTNLLIAGHETTASNSAREILYLLTHPDVKEHFLATRERLPEYIEELVRYMNVVGDTGAALPRLVAEDLEFHGQALRKGEWVMPTPGIANADPSVCPYATRLDLDRDRVSHMTFGFGPHTCLGQHLARAELQEIVSRLFDRFPTARLDGSLEDVVWGPPDGAYRIQFLPVAW